MNITLNVRQKKRTDTEQNWGTKNPILLSGETGYISSGNHAGMSKTGDGTTKWSDLPYDKAVAVGGNADTVGGHTVGADVPSDFQQTLDNLGNVVYRANDSSETVTVPNPVDADTLEGHPASYFATAASLSNINVLTVLSIDGVDLVSGRWDLVSNNATLSGISLACFISNSKPSGGFKSLTIDGTAYTPVVTGGGNIDNYKGNLFATNTLVFMVLDNIAHTATFFPRPTALFTSTASPTDDSVGQDGDVWVVTE